MFSHLIESECFYFGHHTDAWTTQVQQTLWTREETLISLIKISNKDKDHSKTNRFRVISLFSSQVCLWIIVIEGHFVLSLFNQQMIHQVSCRLLPYFYCEISKISVLIQLSFCFMATRWSPTPSLSAPSPPPSDPFMILQLTFLSSLQLPVFSFLHSFILCFLFLFRQRLFSSSSFFLSFSFHFLILLIFFFFFCPFFFFFFSSLLSCCNAFCYF